MISFIRRGLQCESINFNRVSKNLEYILLKISKEVSCFYLFFGYNPPYNIIDSGEFESLWDSLTSLGQVIIMGDFNTQHPDWGSCYPNQLGRYFKDSLINCTDLILLNDKAPTRISIKAGCPDLALCTSNILDKLSFSVGIDSFGSDHFPLLISINNFDRFRCKPQNIFSLTRVNWTSFRPDIEKTPFFNVENFTNVNSTLDKFYTIVKNAVVQASGKVRNEVSDSSIDAFQSPSAHLVKNKKKKPLDTPW